MEFFQLFVLCLTALVWWLARRDLIRRTLEARGPALAEWERLRGTVEELILDLERRAAAAEQRITDAELRLSSSDMRIISAVPPELGKVLSAISRDAQQEAHETRFAPVYALLDQGETDAAEIARRTGLARGEIELILGLRARQASL